MLPSNFMRLVVDSGKPSFCCRTSLLVAVAFLIACNVAAAQQPVSSAAAQESGNATELPPAQPLSQAAVNASGASAPANGVDATKDTSDQAFSATLGPGDLMEVSVYNVPELTSKVRVGNSGDIYLPLIDYVHVEGLTVEEAQTLIEKRLTDGGFVRNPHVMLLVDEASSQGVTILGEVTRPGIYPDVADHKLYEVISQAGGFSPTASRKIAIIRRNQPEPIHIELPRNLADDVSGNIEILPGDTITVPRAPIIYVVGDVNRPSGLLVDNGKLTVLQALALVGGPNHTANLSASRIIHKGTTGVTETKVAVKKMLEAKAPDVNLEADDILFIPVSKTKVLASAGFQTALSAAAAVAIYSVHP